MQRRSGGAERGGRGRLRPAVPESEERYRQLFELSPDPTIIHDGKTVLLANHAAAQFFGLSDPKGAVGRELIGFVHPDWRDRVAERVKAMLTDGLAAPVVEERFLREDGSEVRGEITSAPVTFQGKPAIHVIIRDVSERTRWQEALHESEGRFRGVVESAPMGMHFYHLDPTGRLVFVGANPAADRILGIDHTTLVGKTIEEAFPGLVGTEVPEAYRTIASHGGTWENEQVAYQHGTIDGAFEVHAFQTDSSSMAASFLDITERRRAEAELEQYREHLERLVEERTRDLIKVHEELSSVITVVSRTVEARDPYTAGHQRRVASLARSLAVDLGFTEEQIESVSVAARLHDIGKVSVPAEILSKPARLTPQEYLLIKQHPEIAYQILESVSFRGPVALVVLQHHERLDGSGYPGGLAEDEILPGAKILAVADVVEAMSSHRPYRPPVGVEAAISEIVEHRGTLYDAAVVDACVERFGTGFFFEDAP